MDREYRHKINELLEDDDKWGDTSIYNLEGEVEEPIATDRLPSSAAIFLLVHAYSL